VVNQQLQGLARVFKKVSRILFLETVCLRSLASLVAEQNTVVNLRANEAVMNELTKKKARYHFIDEFIHHRELVGATGS
jgi:hypothetical protein